MEAKFRGKRIDNGKWEIGNLFFNKYNKKCYIVSPEYSAQELAYNAALFDKKIAWHQVHPDSVGMWTGLKDKKGVEIYGGDISQTITKKGVKLSKFVYFYNEGLARFQKRRSDGEVFDCDSISEGGKFIIGNIHQHPELLKE